jgi:hypothetical protein
MAASQCSAIKATSGDEGESLEGNNLPRSSPIPIRGLAVTLSAVLAALRGQAWIAGNLEGEIKLAILD